MEKWSQRTEKKFNPTSWGCQIFHNIFFFLGGGAMNTWPEYFRFGWTITRSIIMTVLVTILATLETLAQGRNFATNFSARASSGTLMRWPQWTIKSRPINVWQICVLGLSWTVYTWWGSCQWGGKKWMEQPVHWQVRPATQVEIFVTFAHYSPGKREDLHKPVGLWPCHNQGGNQYWMLSKQGEIRSVCPNNINIW